MTTEELCAVRETLLEMLAWIELLIPRSRVSQVQATAKDGELNKAAEYFPRVRSGDTIAFVNHLKK